jgi:hypothetical protein
MLKGFKLGKGKQAAAAPVAATGAAHQQALEVLWWRWRHLFLEAQRLRLQARDGDRS